MRAAQVQAFHQGGFVQLNAFEFCVYRFARGIFQARRGFGLRIYPGDGAYVGLFVLRQLSRGLRYAVQVVDDEVGIKKRDQARLIRPLITHGALKNQPVAFRWHPSTNSIALSPHAKTCALRRCCSLQHLIDGAAHCLGPAHFCSFGPRVQAARLTVFKIDGDSHD